MSFTATTYRVHIASPSDLTDERDAATMAINDWNAQHAAAEGIVLLPVKWETHARPESGVRPQAAINTQIVQASDILIGMFWTKLGTGTGVAEPGTVEEINQFVEHFASLRSASCSKPRATGQEPLKRYRGVVGVLGFRHKTGLFAISGDYGRIFGAPARKPASSNEIGQSLEVTFPCKRSIRRNHTAQGGATSQTK